MPGNVMASILGNFSLAMLVLAVFFMIFHKIMVGKRFIESEIVFRWISFFALGVTGVFAFIMHLFFPHLASASIGWFTNPFEYEVAMANLSIGVLGILAFKASYGFRLATVIAATIWLWGDALVHIYQMVAHNNFAVGNAGSWFWMDIVIPFLLIICISNLRPGKLITL
ncbi:MAG: hypothetical protein H0W64_04605 [Gammaproteobacteria bacterium]|nr:hypothetical protein [Gammaproteobacteria bacterium]